MPCQSGLPSVAKRRPASAPPQLRKPARNAGLRNTWNRPTREAGGRLYDEDVTCLHRLDPEINHAVGGGEDWFVNGYYLDHSAVGRNNLKREALKIVLRGSPASEFILPAGNI